MFDFLKIECPVEQIEKKWIEDSLLWFYSPAREIEFKKYEFIAINKYFASIDINLKKEHLHKIFEKVKKQIELLIDLDCEIKLVDEDQIPLAEGLKMKSYSGGNFTYRSNILENKFTLELNSKYLNDPLYVVKAISYSLAYYKLLEGKPSLEISGFFNEMANIVFGFGVFQANSVITQKKWKGIRTYGWLVGSRGFLTQQMNGYALALATFLKDDKNLNWSDYLCKDVKTYFDKSNKFIKTNFDYYSSYKNEVINNFDISMLPPDYLYLKREYYKNGKIYWESEMKNGHKEGITHYYHENGNEWAAWEFKKGTPWNVIFNKDKSNNPVEMGTLKNGTGTLYSYRPDGELSWIAEYENGILKNNEIIKDFNIN